ncbi:MAG TPA: hypothetical protein PKE51_12355 [Gemmatimonadaceae bacterium]|nr:hypothetical protein [Gemmatimonadaceae bacterium]
MITLTALRARYRDDTRPGGPGATPALTRALERIGWRAVQEPTPEELGSYLVLLLEDCVAGHGDIPALLDAIARVLRDVGPLLDGGLPPVEAYLPAAETLLEHYGRDDGATTDR